MAAEDHLSKKEQHNHKGIYFMICNEVQILATTLNNQSKPNFPSLQGQRVYKFITNGKRSGFWSTWTFLVATDELHYNPCLFDRGTKAQNYHLCSYTANHEKGLKDASRRGVQDAVISATELYTNGLL